MRTFDYQSVPQHDHNGHTAVPGTGHGIPGGNPAHVGSIHYCCQDCGTEWTDTSPLCDHCHAAPWDVWYPTSIPAGDTDDAQRLRLCAGCALEMARRLIELAGEVIDDRTAGSHTPPAAAPANRAQRRHAARQHPVTAITRRARGRVRGHA